ncbi:MAG: hypothetical protein RBU37_04520 [Myxococcota bacterium]|jgi:hypothetical protein|nr:hypothetical protein [Myxococcota bacterium]
MPAQLSFNLLLAPEQGELHRLMRLIAARLFDAQQWTPATASAESDIFTSADTQLSISRSAPGQRAKVQAQLQQLGGTGQAPNRQEGEQKLSYRYDAVPSFELLNLEDPQIDLVWQLLVSQQAEALRAWIKGKAAAPSPLALPRIAQVPFAPDEFPLWLVRGELAALPRLVPATALPIASVRMAAQPEQRLLLRAVHAGEEQSLVPLCLLQDGHRFFSAPCTRPFRNAAEVMNALLRPLSSLLGVAIEVPKSSREKATPPSQLYLSRWAEIEQDTVRSFHESATIGRIIRSDATIRMLELRAADGPAYFELAIDGLPDKMQLFVVGKPDSVSFGVRAFGLAPAARIPEMERLLESAL